MHRALPESVLHADGRSEPFEPERITRSLFAAAEPLGKADAFLARELTESVLHFLSADHEGPEISSMEIAEIVTKVVRELGHPELARAYEDSNTRRRAKTPDSRAITALRQPDWFDPMMFSFELTRSAAAGPLEAYCLSHVYPPELVSAHVEGLIRLTNLAAPLEFVGSVEPVPPRFVFESLAAARQAAGCFVAIDGPEYDLAVETGTPSEVAHRYVEDLRHAAILCGITPILNLNIQSPPPRLAGGVGPLFESDSRDDSSRRNQIAIALAEESRGTGFSIWWHLAPAVSDVSQHAGIVTSASDGRAIEFVFDRPGQAIKLGPGLNRICQSSLEFVEINVGRLVEMMGGPPVEAAALLKKVASLSRFAKTAAHAKQDFLRRYGKPALKEGFRLDRARLVLSPLGLAEAARASERGPVEFARDILKAIRHAVETDRPRSLPAVIDSPLWGPESISHQDVNASTRQLVKAASTLHAACGAGRLILPVDNREEAIRLAAEGSVFRIAFKDEPNP